MSESGRESDEYDYSDYDSSADSEFTDNLHSSDEESETESEDVHGQQVAVRQRRFVGNTDSEFECEEVIAIRKTKVKDEPQNYAPDRWPPIIDFIFVFSSFLAAAVAAYFTIF